MIRNGERPASRPVEFAKVKTVTPSVPGSSISLLSVIVPSPLK